MLAFQIYRGMNPNADVMTNPYRQTMTFLSYIRGSLVDDWVQEQAQWLVDQIQGGCNATAGVIVRRAFGSSLSVE